MGLINAAVSAYNHLGWTGLVAQGSLHKYGVRSFSLAEHREMIGTVRAFADPMTKAGEAARLSFQLVGTKANNETRVAGVKIYTLRANMKALTVAMLQRFEPSIRREILDGVTTLGFLENYIRDSHTAEDDIIHLAILPLLIPEEKPAPTDHDTVRNESWNAKVESASIAKKLLISKNRKDEAVDALLVAKLGAWLGLRAADHTRVNAVLRHVIALSSLEFSMRLLFVAESPAEGKSFTEAMSGEVAFSTVLFPFIERLKKVDDPAQFGAWANTLLFWVAHVRFKDDAKAESYGVKALYTMMPIKRLIDKALDDKKMAPKLAKKTYELWKDFEGMRSTISPMVMLEFKAAFPDLA